jgi:hypothetical protein
MARARVNTKLIAHNWDDLLRRAELLHHGPTSAPELMRSILGRELIRVASATDPHIDPPVAQNVEGRHARRNVQRMMDRRQDDSNA